MEQIINARLRSQAFWKFIIMFLITILIIVLAIFFDYQVPLKDNQMLRSKVIALEDDSIAQMEFITLIEISKSSIDSLGKSDLNKIFYNMQLIDDKSKELAGVRFKDNGLFSETNKTMFNLFYDYKELKKQMLQLQKDQTRIKELEEKFKQCESDYKQAQRDLDNFRNLDNLSIN